MENQKMSKFLVFLQDVNYDDSFTPELIQKLTIEHVEHVKDLDSRGILFLCGLLKETEKGMLILKAKTYEEVESYVLKDPFIINKCYKSFVINEIIEGNADNNYLLDAHAE